MASFEWQEQRYKHFQAININLGKRFSSEVSTALCPPHAMASAQTLPTACQYLVVAEWWVSWAAWILWVGHTCFIWWNSFCHYTYQPTVLLGIIHSTVFFSAAPKNNMASQASNARPNRADPSRQDQWLLCLLQGSQYTSHLFAVSLGTIQHHELI